MTALKEQARKISRNEWFIPVLFLVLVSALTYLPLIGQLGFYRDDWHVVWGGTIYGPQKIIDLHAIDRPVMGVSYALAYAVLGSRPLGWHLYAFFLRLAGGLSFFWLVRMLWRENRLATTAMAALFLLYPGFLQQPNANAYHCHLLGFAAAVFSMAASVRVLQTSRRFEKLLLTVLAMVSGLGCFLIMEYMVGLELVRLMMLAYVIWSVAPQSQKVGRLLRNILIQWLPYFLMLAGFLFWRVFIFKSARSATDVGELGRSYAGDPLNMLLRLAVETVKDFFDTVLFGWFVPFYNVVSQARYGDLFFSLLLAALVIFLFYRYIRIEKGLKTEQPAGEQEANTGRRVLKHAIWLGVVAALIALAPAVMANRQVEFSDAFDRYTLPGVIGGSMLLVGLLYSLLSNSSRTVVLAALLGISVITQFNNAVFFKDYWEYERQLWWQLSWRAPDLKDGTSLVAVLPQGYRLWESYEIWGPANLIYNRQEGPLKVSGEVLNEQTLVPMMLQESFLKTIRRVEYTLDFKNSLIVNYPAVNSCVQVIDSGQASVSEFSDPMIRLVAGNSQIDMIESEAQPQSPPQEIFGVEPQHTWCYYYQKASLARQQGDWEEAARLGDEATEQGLQPGDDSEWMPFYQAYAYLRRFDDANRIGAILRENYSFLSMYCHASKGVLIEEGPDARIEKFMIENICGAE